MCLSITLQESLQMKKPAATRGCYGLFSGYYSGKQDRHTSPERQRRDVPSLALRACVALSCRGNILPSSVEEGHVPHGPGLPLGVHDDLVPAVERDGGVVGVPDPALDVDAGVAAHSAPAPALRLRATSED